MTAYSTYEEYLQHQEIIDQLIAPTGLSSILLTSLLRLKEKEERHPKRLFMKSEFAGIGIEMALDREWVTAVYRAFDWHPQGVGTYYYGLTAEGIRRVEEALAILQEHQVKIYY